MQAFLRQALNTTVKNLYAHRLLYFLSTLPITKPYKWRGLVGAFLNRGVE
jgi:hypothetical protein